MLGPHPRVRRRQQEGADQALAGKRWVIPSALEFEPIQLMGGGPVASQAEPSCFLLEASCCVPPMTHAEVTYFRDRGLMWPEAEASVDRLDTAPMPSTPSREETACPACKGPLTAQ